MQISNKIKIKYLPNLSIFQILVTKSLLKLDTSLKWDTKVLLPHLHLLPNQKGFNKGPKAKAEDQPNLKEQAKPFPMDFKELKNQTYLLITWFFGTNIMY